MNNKILYKVFPIAALGMLTMFALPASAALMIASAMTDTTSLSVSAMTSLKTGADAKIDARISVLNTLEARINQMQRVSDSEKASLDTTLEASLSDMASLKAKIDADTDGPTLKADIQTITKSYRIYLLVLPQGRIVATGDRVMTISGLLDTLSGKLQTRITAAGQAGQNITSLSASLSDMNAKDSDATVQAQAAITEVAGLVPDNGDNSIYQSNQTALKDARAKLKVAITDLKTARQDAGIIVKGLESMKLSVSGSATTTGSAQ